MRATSTVPAAGTVRMRSCVASKQRLGKSCGASPGSARCSLLYVDGHLICLSEYGTLRVLKATCGAIRGGERIDAGRCASRCSASGAATSSIPLGLPRCSPTGCCTCAGEIVCCATTWRRTLARACANRYLGDSDANQLIERGPRVIQRCVRNCISRGLRRRALRRSSHRSRLRLRRPRSLRSGRGLRPAGNDSARLAVLAASRAKCTMATRMPIASIRSQVDIRLDQDDTCRTPV